LHGFKIILFIKKAISNYIPTHITYKILCAV